MTKMMRVLVMGFLVGGLAVSGSVLADKDPPKAEKGIEGTWQGSLKVADQELRLVVKLDKKADGAFKGTLDSIDQGAKDLSLDEISFKEGQVRFELKLAKAVFEGKLNPEGTEITGEWRQGEVKLPLTLKKTDKPVELVRPQEPKKPYPYLEEEVVFENKKAGVKLAGTLTMPKEKGPFPVVLLITGSGPQDRDETMLGHKPFLVLADHLTRKGIAVLRVDDRGVGKSTGSLAKATTEDLAEDVLAGVEFLKERKEINAKQIGLIGHSEGGLIAPMVATQSKEVAFIVLLAGPGVPGDQLLTTQGQAVLKTAGATEETLAQQRAIQEKFFKAIKEEKDEEALEKRLRAIIAEEVAKMEEKDKKDAEKLKSQLEGQVKFTLSPWLRFFLTYDPATALAKVECPVLALNGEKDVQVDAKQNLGAIEKTLKGGKTQEFTVKELANLNHLFQTCKTGAVSEYGKIEETLAPVVLETITEWVLKRINPK